MTNADDWPDRRQIDHCIQWSMNGCFIVSRLILTYLKNSGLFNVKRSIAKVSWQLIDRIN